MDHYDAAVALITVTNVETDAVMRLYSWKKVCFENDRQIYYEASFMRDGRSFRVITAKQNEMGMTAGATLTCKIISHFRPRYVIMVGIAAGVALPDVADQIYGDVILANVVWNYSNGKFVSPDKADIKFGEVGFIPRPTYVYMRKWLLPYIEKALAAPENQSHVIVGPIASGSTVVANREVLEKQIHSSFRETAALDMEAYAIAYAAENATDPRPVSLIIKSVCD